MSLNKERDLLYAVLEAGKEVERVEQEIARFQPELQRLQEVKESAEKMLIDYMEDTGKKSFVSQDFRVAVTKREDFYASFDKENKEEAIRWIEEDCGHPEIIKRDPQVHQKTLSSFIQRRIKDAEPVPANLFKMFWKKVLSIKEV